MTSNASQTSRGGATAQERFAYHRHAAEMARVRYVMVVAVTVTVFISLGYDVLVFPSLGRGALWPLLTVQGAMIAFQSASLTLLYRDPLPPERFIVPMGAVNFILASIAIAFMATRFGGVISPLPAGALCLGLMVQVMALPRPWPIGGLVAAATVLVYPLTVVALATGDDRLAAELRSDVARAHLTGEMVVLTAAAVLATWGGHVIWALRRSAFESRSIGRYRLLRRIGKGGMGEVWRAHDRALRRDVALKLLSPDHKNDPDRVARFEREIEATAELTHPHTIRIHDWGVTHDGVWYYAMELLEGLDLSTLIKRHGRLPAPLVVHLGMQAARALAEAHARGIVHRDIKPANLFLVARDGTIDHLKVLDFGVARVDDAPELTHAGALIGTPGYLAPELLAGAPATAASDVWALAATLYLAATGASWPGPLDALPPPLAALLARSLSASPADRPADAAAFADALAATHLADHLAFRLEPAPAPALPAGADQVDTLAHEPTVRARP